MNSADAIVAALKDAGIDMIFGVPGGGTGLELIEAGMRSGMRFVLTQSESAALFMASTCAEITGVPGVALCGLGPGVTNSVNGLAHALLDRIPIILIADRYPEPQASLVSHQKLDHRSLLGTLVKWSATLSADAADSITRRAIREACIEPCGPVHLDFPQSETTKPVGIPEGRHVPASPSLVTGLGLPSQDLLGEARRMLWSAKRPVAVVGLQARRPGLHAAPALRALAALARMPVFATYKAKGLVAETGPWWIGTFTNAVPEAEVLSRADLILMVGVDAVEFLPRPWSFSAPVISVVRTPDPSRYAPIAVELEGDIAGCLERLLDGQSGASVWKEAEVVEYRRRLQGQLRSSDNGLDPARAIELARRMASPRAVACVDSGAHMFPATELWTAPEPGRFFISSGLATMGYALPASVAAALLMPDDPVFCFTGDGGLLMQLGELRTAARLGVRTITVVFDDHTLSLIKLKQDQRGYASAGVDLGSADLARVSEGLAVPARVASSEDELESALTWALRANGPVLISAKVEAAAYRPAFRAIRG